MKTLNASGFVLLNATIFVIVGGYAMDIHNLPIAAASAWLILWLIGRFSSIESIQPNDGLTDRQREFKDKFNHTSPSQDPSRMIKITLISGDSVLIDEHGVVTFTGEVPKDIQRAALEISEQIKQLGFDVVNASVVKEFEKIQEEKEK